MTNNELPKNPEPVAEVLDVKPVSEATTLTEDTTKLRVKIPAEELDPNFNPFEQTVITPNTYILIRLPSDTLRIVKMIPGISVNLGKFGSFWVDDILGHPFGLTYEIFGTGPEEKGLVKNRRAKKGERKTNKQRAEEAEEEQVDVRGPRPQLRIVPALDNTEEQAKTDEMMPEENNKDLVYDPDAMKLSMAEIEALKRTSVDSGREVIQKMIAAHTSFDKKTTFSQEKYIKRKEQKFLRRFATEPLGAAQLLQVYLEKDPYGRVRDMSEESLALMMSMANVKPGGKYLVVDDASGLLVYAMLERMAGQGTIVLAHANEHTSLDALKYIKASEAWIESRVRTINWLDFLHPEEHDLCIMEEALGNGEITEPVQISQPVQSADGVPTENYPYRFVERTAEELAAMKPHQRAQYFRRAKRHADFATARTLIDEAPGLDAVLVTTDLDLPELMPQLVDRLRGAAPLVAYSPFKETLVPTAHILQKDLRVLAPTIIETRVRRYQTLPGRMHPLMTSRGGGGYLLCGTRVFPTDVDAAGGARGRKRKTKEENGAEPASKQVKTEQEE
ncbi:uncharacterized protein SAPINGB_P004040 [Magnusiomyces paraingens]|uniref:tRNA (adenine(58)-N(1))-methyltransferase non-catalytic subunit TRM6 n=1 Tax=Magnusiomyces paraingens TaxID=2606893 RepID=A0A5E8BXX1_9ASCO|nr:uncharacterized protein SAPINGB_P004040 [Saprochaete ingens]VVT54367.1 unnamed protein product [Saprochaete ingens]